VESTGEGASKISGDTTSLSAAFSSIPLNEPESDSSDPWSTIQKPTDNPFSEESNDDWLASAQQHTNPTSAHHVDWVDFDDDGETRAPEVSEEDEEEGEDVPIRLSFGSGNHERGRSVERSYSSEKRDDDSVGSSSSGLDSDDEDETQHKAKPKTKEVKEASVRSAIDDD